MAVGGGWSKRRRTARAVAAGGRGSSVNRGRRGRKRGREASAQLCNPPYRTRCAAGPYGGAMPESTATQFGRARDIGTAKRVSFGIKISTLLHLKIVFKEVKIKKICICRCTCLGKRFRTSYRLQPHIFSFCYLFITSFFYSRKKFPQ